VPGILAALDDPREEVRRAAIEQLPVLEHPTALDRLIDALVRETPRNRAAAAHALRAVDDPAVAWPLQRALGDPDPWVRYFAADAIARRRTIEAVPALVQVSAHDPATHVRIAALLALGALDVPDAVDVAAGQIESADPDLAAAAVSALAGASDPRAERLLEEAIRSSNVACRIPAAHALSARPSRTAARALAWAARLDDPPELRPLAIEGLARIAGCDPDTPDCLEVRAAAVAVLLELAAERDAHEHALTALATLTPAAIQPTAAALSSGSVPERLAAVEALGRMRHPAASEALARALHDEDPSVRGAAVSAFGRLGTTAVREAVIRMQSSDADPGVRHRAAALCRRHGWGAETQGGSGR
jgi:HEAT repeat protein